MLMLIELKTMTSNVGLLTKNIAWKKGWVGKDPVFLYEDCVMSYSLIMNVSNSFHKDSLSVYTSW